MPIIESMYKSPFLFKNKHLQTIYTLMRKKAKIVYQRERINTPDGDFIDLDWSKTGSRKLTLIFDGFERDTYSANVLGMVKAFNKRDWDAVGYNFRGCSGEVNRFAKSYHAGSTDDLGIVVDHIISLHAYEKIAIIGFSVGGNMLLKYFGEMGNRLSTVINKAVAVSALCDLKSSALKISNSFMYINYFLNKCHKKIKAKIKVMPDKINDNNFQRIKTFKQYDDRYTAPQHGFKNAEDYWEKASSKQFLLNIKIPTLVINPKNDPLLAEASYPIDEAKESKFIYLEMPDSGGHCGFITFNKENETWLEKRVADFILSEKI